MISICLATYNGEKHLYDTLKSIQSQTYSDFECIIVDDHSTDSTIQLLTIFASEDSRFKVFINTTDKSNPYVDSHNKSYEYASGDYLIRIDQDDILKENFVNTCVNYMESHKDCDAVATYNTFFEEVDGEFNIIDYIPNKIMNERSTIFNENPLFLYNEHPDAWFNQSSCIRKTFYDKCKPKFTYAKRGDIVFWWGVLSKGAILKTIPERLVLHRCYKSSTYYNKLYNETSNENKFQEDIAQYKADAFMHAYMNTSDIKYLDASKIFVNTVNYFKNL